MKSEELYAQTDLGEQNLTSQESEQEEKTVERKKYEITRGIYHVEPAKHDLVLEVVVFPNPPWGNNYSDGLIFTRGKKNVRITPYSEGRGWARPGMHGMDAYAERDAIFIKIEEYEAIIKQLEDAVAIDDVIDRDAVLVGLVKSTVEKYS